MKVLIVCQLKETVWKAAKEVEGLALVQYSDLVEKVAIVSIKHKIKEQPR